MSTCLAVLGKPVVTTKEPARFGGAVKPAVMIGGVVKPAQVLRATGVGQD